MISIEKFLNSFGFDKDEDINYVGFEEDGQLYDGISFYNKTMNDHLVFAKTPNSTLPKCMINHYEIWMKTLKWMDIMRPCEAMELHYKWSPEYDRDLRELIRRQMRVNNIQYRQLNIDIYENVIFNLL